MVYISCPATGSVVETHHILPDVGKLNEAINRHIPVPCPYCQIAHEWTDTNGFFLSQGEKSPLIAKDVEL